MQTEAGTPLSPEIPNPASCEDAPVAATAGEGPAGNRRNFMLVVLIGVVWVAVDQITKVWAVHALSGAAPVPLVGELLQLRLVYNPGAAFSLGTGSTWVFTVLASVVVVVLLWQARHLGSTGWTWALGLLLGGAAGNLIDRLVRAPGFGQGHVVDFLALPSFPVFNVADMGITAAAVLIAVLALRGIGLDGTREPSRAERSAAGRESS